MVMIKRFRATGAVLIFDCSVQGKIILKSISQNYKKSFSMCILHLLSYKWNYFKIHLMIL